MISPRAEYRSATQTEVEVDLGNPTTSPWPNGLAHKEAELSEGVDILGGPVH